MVFAGVYLRFATHALPQASTKTSSQPTWASAADQGVRPTLHSFVRGQVRALRADRN